MVLFVFGCVESCHTMADDLFSFENMNEDEGGGPSEDEYDALNDETFGGDGSELDWEEEHEQMAHITESSRHPKDHLDLEASLSRLVLEEETPQPQRQHPVWPQLPQQSGMVSGLKNVVSVEELERQLRQTQPQQMSQQQNFFQPRFPPVILQRPPGLQAPVPLPFAPQQPMNPGLQLNQMNQNQINQILSHANQMSHGNQIGPGNQMPHGNQMGTGNQMSSGNQMGLNNQMGPPGNQIGACNQMVTGNQMGMGNQMSLGSQMGHSNQSAGNQMVQNNHIGPNNQIGPNNHIPNMQMGSNNQMGLNQMGPNNQMNSQMGPGNHQMGPNNQIGSNPMGPSNPISNLMGLSNQINNQIVPNNQLGNQMGSNQMGTNNQLGNQMAPNNQMGPNNQLGNQMGPNHQIGSNNQMGPNGQTGPNNQMGPNGQIMNGNQFGIVPNQMPMIPPHLLGQARMMGPPPSLNNVPRQPFPNQGQYNTNFRGPMDKSGGMLMNQQMGNQGQPGNQAANQAVNQMHQQSLFNQQNNQVHQSMPMFNQSSHHVNQSQMSNPTTQGGQQQISPQVNKQKTVNRPTNDKQKQPQRPLVFNNSALSSQNLVQLIQSTHPMLQMHLHNATHHPVLNARFNRQPSVQRVYGNNRYMNGESQRDSSDEYAGLMSQREKQWLLNIQMMQLNTGTPYIEDYYYTVWQERQSRAEREGVKEAHKANQQNHPFYSGGKQEQHERHRHNSTSEDQPTPRTYVPTQFENSLGKLQCGSVTAPRKIIDVEVVRETEPSGAPSARQSRAPSVASTTHPHDGPREIRRTKQCLLDIEALYLVLLRLEELNDPLAITNALILREREEKARLAEAVRCEEEGLVPDTNLFLRNIESVQRRSTDTTDKADKRQVVSLTVSAEPPKQKNLLDESKDELMGRIFAGLLFEDRLQTYLGIRKGKLLMERFLARVPASHPRLRTLWSRTLRALPAAARRDARDDNALPRLAHAFRKYINNSNGWAAILEACAHLSEALDPARQPYALLSPFTLTVVTILMEKASTLINTADATSNERQWTKFLKTLARTIKHATSITVAKPTEHMKRTDVQNHVRLLESKSTVEILQRGKTTAEFADLSKNEFGEILVKHLC